MAAKYEKIIKDYCVRNGITVPSGFGRNTPSRYAVIRTNAAPPKLIAVTWFKVTDLVYYIQHTLVPELGDGLDGAIDILHFQEGRRLKHTGGSRLETVGEFTFAE